MRFSGRMNPLESLECLYTWVDFWYSRPPPFDYLMKVFYEQLEHPHWLTTYEQRYRIEPIKKFYVYCSYCFRLIEPDAVLKKKFNRCPYCIHAL